MLEHDSERVRRIARELTAQGIKLPYAIPRQEPPTYEPQRIPARSQPLHRVLIAVSNHTGVSPDRMGGNRPGRRSDCTVTRARWLYFWLARLHTTCSLVHIGTLTSDTNHATVAHALRCIAEDMGPWQADIAAIEDMLK
jgi:chromosomal replication initiation ATPase DnaA